jgi:hypothetical protein
MDFWIYAGPLAVAAVGYFIASEISNLRKQITKLNETQTQMAISLAQLQARLERQ